MAKKGAVLTQLLGGVLVVYLNRPGKLNALNKESLKGLKDAVRRASRDSKVKAVLFAGKGRVFSAGADLSEMRHFGEKEALSFSRLGQGVFSKIEELKKPTLALVHGAAFGGGNELALSCDYVFATPDARFAQPEKRFALIPGFGGLYRLSRVIRSRNDLNAVLSGRTLTARQALALGLVDELHDAREAKTQALTFLEHAARHDSLSMPSRKKPFTRKEKSLERKAFELEGKEFAALFKSGAPQRLMKAFLERKQ